MSFNQFFQKVSIYIENNQYIVKTISEKDDFKEVLRLRYYVFYEELLEKKKLIKMDKDKFDNLCDHIVVVDKASEKIVGTYRVNCSLFNSQFYSATEFNIDEILEQEGTKLELGRACIHKDFRKNTIIMMLWRGITEYIKLTDAKYLFGLSSSKGQEESTVKLFKYFRYNDYLNEQFCVFPKKNFKMPKFSDKLVLVDISDETHRSVPNLIKFYLKAGCKVCGEPAYDKKMKCYDFFTFLEISHATKDVEKKFFKV
jgi:putative hemolysin